MDSRRIEPDLIDLADGLDRVMGDRQLYTRMLARFRRDYADGAAPVLLALERGALAEAQRLAHTIKGAAGLIGAHTLYTQATVTEQLIRTGVSRQREAAEALHRQFTLVLQQLDGLLAGEQQQLRTAPQAMLEDPELLARLTGLLLDGDGGAVDLVKQYAASLTAILGDTRYQELAAAVNAFDYALALASIRSDAGP